MLLVSEASHLSNFAKKDSFLTKANNNAITKQMLTVTQRVKLRNQLIHQILKFDHTQNVLLPRQAHIWCCHMRQTAPNFICAMEILQLQWLAPNLCTLTTFWNIVILHKVPDVLISKFIQRKRTCVLRNKLNKVITHTIFEQYSNALLIRTTL